MPGMQLHVVYNLNQYYQPTSMLSIETDKGSVVPVFTTNEAAKRFLMSPALQRWIEQGGGPKGIIEQTVSSFDDWLFQLRMLDRSTEHVTFLLDTDPLWQTLSARLS